jgi:hypothetical protein
MFFGGRKYPELRITGSENRPLRRYRLSLTGWFWRRAGGVADIFSWSPAGRRPAAAAQ